MLRLTCTVFALLTGACSVADTIPDWHTGSLDGLDQDGGEVHTGFAPGAASDDASSTGAQVHTGSDAAATRADAGVHTGSADAGAPALENDAGAHTGLDASEPHTGSDAGASSDVDAHTGSADAGTPDSGDVHTGSDAGVQDSGTAVDPYMAYEPVFEPQPDPSAPTDWRFGRETSAELGTVAHGIVAVKAALHSKDYDWYHFTVASVPADGLDVFFSYAGPPAKHYWFIACGKRPSPCLYGSLSNGECVGTAGGDLQAPGEIGMGVGCPADSPAQVWIKVEQVSQVGEYAYSADVVLRGKPRVVNYVSRDY